LLAFVGFTAALAVALETVKPEWRDPEFALRLQQVREWNGTERPLVLAFGSSRTQMGLDPAAMGFADDPGAPVIYNFGYSGAYPVRAWFQFTRVLDAGVKPDAVLIQLAPPEVMIQARVEKQMVSWGSRMSRADIRRLSPLLADDTALQREWFEARTKPWITFRRPLLYEIGPEWLPTHERTFLRWGEIDRYGFAPYPDVTIPSDIRDKRRAQYLRRHAAAFADFAPKRVQEAVYREWTNRCRDEGIALAFFWAPESPRLLGGYSARSRIELERYTAWLNAELQAPVFPFPTHLDEEDFVDGYHLLRDGAAKYSRWLADHHLRPWLEESGIGHRP
jgi:hypothetical protein